jgi:uncharacterized repeat protein (TIGR02543 family)
MELLHILLISASMGMTGFTYRVFDGTGYSNTATVTITVNAPSPVVQFSAANFNVAEDGATATITVKRLGDLTGAVSVDYATSDDTATVTADYTAASGTLNWADGDGADKTFNVSISDDSDVEGNETVTLTLSNATGGVTVSGTNPATLTIIDDDVVPNTYTLTVNNGTGGGGYTQDTVVPISATVPANSSFVNWTGDTAYVTNVNSESTTVTMPALNIAVTANFALDTYTVSYNGNGNTGGTVPGDQTKTHDVDLALETQGTLVRTGYLFLGWNTASDGSGTSYAAGANYTANSNLTLFANWGVGSYLVTYDGNTNTGGSVPVDGNNPYDTNDEVVVIGNTGNLVKTGYSFTGWNTASDGSGTPYSPSATFSMPASNITLYAQWTINQYTITFDSAGGTAVSPITQDYDTAVPPPRKSD